MAERYFNREEAEELLSMIGKSLESAQEQKRFLDNLDQELAAATARIMMLGGSIPPYQDLVRKKSEREQFVARLEEVVNQIQETGCVVKDLDMGLVDFPALHNGQEVYLCWKLGEKRIDYWHGVEEGFAGRKPLDQTGEDDESGSSRIQ
ncbi:MAG TPA: DUF2203 domain-containing protein [Terriglobia bacterium]|nr:DUF2203 domain-containing protein [Terriglobia bacterium]